MPEYFVPGATDDEQADRVRASVIRNAGIAGITSRKIFKLAYVHDSQEYEAEVGQPDALADGGRVLMILAAANEYLVFTANRGVVSGAPIVVGKSSARSVEEFD